jgi:hypothetical protein
MPAQHLKIYPSKVPVNIELQKQIISKLTDFLATWKAHGSSLKSEAFFLYDHFLCININEEYTLASGCSLDTLSNFILKIEQTHKISLNDRAFTYIKRGETTIPLAFNACADFELQPNDLVYNLMLTDASQLASNFIIPIKGSSFERLFV